MRAQDFAEKCANVFLIGLPTAVLGTPLMAIFLGEFAHGAADFIMSAVAIVGYIGIPIVGLSGACVGIWCYIKKDYAHKLSKQLMVICILAMYVWAASVATQVYKSMKHEARVDISPNPDESSMSGPTLKRDCILTPAQK